MPYVLLIIQILTIPTSNTDTNLTILTSNTDTISRFLLPEFWKVIGACDLGNTGEIQGHGNNLCLGGLDHPPQPVHVGVPGGSYIAVYIP